MTNDDRKSLTPQFFNQEMADSYDEKNSKLAPIADNMHFLVRLVLGDLPPRARILCVGIGTGAEILSLAKAHPEWSFVGVDPSAEMLGVCREKLKHADVLDRCELVHGFVRHAPEGAEFDAVVSILVAHFVGCEDRTGFYRDIHDRLKPGGCFVSTEICFDLDSAELPAMLKNWERVQTLMGATPDSLRKLPDTLRNALCVLSPAKTEALLRTAGFDVPVPFFQAFLVRGVHATKRDMG
jgi:tRNA (cmo5U34)-methyltransferase